MATVWWTFDRFLAGELPLEELLDWVAGTPALADLLAPEELGRLRGIDPTGRTAFGDATASVTAIYETHRRGRLDRDRAERIASDMLAGTIDPAAGTRALARLRNQGAEWIPEAFTGLTAALDDLPQPSADPLVDAPGFAARVATALDRGRQLRAPALVAARRLLDRLKE